MDSKIPFSDEREFVENLNKAIDHYHDLFISEDSLLMNSDVWKCLQESARKYLCLVPQNRKFKFNETERVLNQSANSREDFDPREACQAFEYLAKYAQNLLKQPWRQEFHTIQLTSGFYVHNVAAHLKNAHEILIAMGYVNISDKSLKLVPNYELSTIRAVSRDCVLAAQECLVLSHIWEKVSFEEPNYPFTTDQIYEFRSGNKGNVEGICKIILEEVRSKSVSKIHENQNTSSLLNCTPNPSKHRVVQNSKNVNENRGNYSKMESEEHFYDAVSPGEVSRIFSPTARRSKSMTFSTSTPKRVSCSSDKNESDKYFSAEITLSGDVLDGSLSPKAASDIGHVYSNVPSHRDKNSSKTLLNREKTKWHTPMKYKLQPQGHLKFSKLNERELSYLMKDEADDMKKDSRKSGNINQKGDRKMEVYDSTNFPRVREKLKNAPPEKVNYNVGNKTTNCDMQHIEEADGSSTKTMSSNETFIPQLKRYTCDSVPHTTKSTEQTKSSNSESSYLHDGGFNYKKYDSGASSTDASSWDMKMKLEEGKKNDTGDQHFYDVPEASDNHPNVSVRKDPCSRSSFGLCQNDDTVYYDDPNESIGFGFATESPRRNLNQNEKNVRDNNSTFFTCDESFKSLVELDKSSNSKVKKESKLDDLEDVWFHTLLKKEGGFNYLDSKYDEPMSEFDSFPEQIQSGPKKSKSGGKYFPSATENSATNYATDGFDKRLDKGSDIDYNIYNKPSAAGKLDDSIINANLHKKVSKITQTSKGTIESPSSRSKGAEGGLPLSSGQKLGQFDPWECNHCTFINYAKDYICEICSKTKNYTDDDHDVIEGVESLLPRLYSLPEYIKGDINNIFDDELMKPPKLSTKTCPQCTLINISSARLCEACGFRLKEFNSPAKTTWLEDMFVPKDG